MDGTGLLWETAEKKTLRKNFLYLCQKVAWENTLVCWEYFFGIPALGILSEKLGCLVIPPCLRRGEHTAKKEVLGILGDLRIRRKGK